MKRPIISKMLLICQIYISGGQQACILKADNNGFIKKLHKCWIKNNYDNIFRADVRQPDEKMGNFELF